MKTRLLPGLLAAALLLPGLRARAGVAVTIDHNPADATDPFHFKTVPIPRRNSAQGATFAVVDGEAGTNGGSLDVLHDGELPGEVDEPDRNFFFEDGQDGGRLLVDFGRTIAVKEVDTYSRHADTRAPQVYKVYGGDGGGEGFDPKPGAPRDPATRGWKLVAVVNTESKYQMDGGQYGVSITDAAGILGNYRYLLFVVSRTEGDDAFGNTFFSEIVVLNRDAPDDGKPLAAAHPAKQTNEYDHDGLHLTITNDDPNFDPEERERLARTFFIVYPRMAAEYNKHASRKVVISIEKRFHGVAATEGNRIHVNPEWFHSHPEDLDVVTHEGMHVVQAYEQWDPAWLREGLADYARYQFGVNNQAADWSMPPYDAGQSYEDAYRVTARFLAWLDKRVKPGTAKALDQSLREGVYGPETWNRLTGKSVEEMWRAYGQNPAL